MLDKLSIQNFLAIAIIVIIGAIIVVLLVLPVKLDPEVQGLLLTIVGVLLACFKDVFQFYFGSSQGSKSKDEALVVAATAGAAPATPPSP